MCAGSIQAAKARDTRAASFPPRVDGIKIAEAVTRSCRLLAGCSVNSMKLDDVKKLHLKRYREEFGYFLVEGEHLVLELQKAALHNPLLRACELYVTPAHESWRSAVPDPPDRRIPHVAGRGYEKSAGHRRAGSHPADSGSTRRRARDLSARDPGSRQPRHDSADAGLVRKFPLPARARKCRSLQSQSGSRQRRRHFSRSHRDRCARWIRCASASRASPAWTCRGKAFTRAQFGQFDCYVFGNEARGVPREQLTALGAQPYTIGGIGAIESLNLAAAVNMCVYELNRLAHGP